MSRSGYSDSLSEWSLICWRGQVASAVRGKRGQQFLRDLLAALDAMPHKRLIAHQLVQPDGEVCALGCVVQARGLTVGRSPEEWDDPEPQRRELAVALNIAHSLVAEVEFMNDEAYCAPETPEHRWHRMRHWVASLLK